MKKLFLLGIFIPFLNTSCCSIFTSAKQTVTFVGEEGTRIYDNGMKIATIGESGETSVRIRKKISSKVFILPPFSERPEAHLPKRKCIWSQTHLRFPPNVKEFSIKLFGVFFQTPRLFRPKSHFSHKFSRI